MCVGQPRGCHEKNGEPRVGLKQWKCGTLERVQGLEQPRHHDHQNRPTRQTGVDRSPVATGGRNFTTFIAAKRTGPMERASRWLGSMP